MRKIITTALGVSLIVASVQMAAAAEHRRHAHKANNAFASQQFRDAHNAQEWPTESDLFVMYHNTGN